MSVMSGLRRKMTEFQHVKIRNSAMRRAIEAEQKMAIDDKLPKAERKEKVRAVIQRFQRKV